MKNRPRVTVTSSVLGKDFSAVLDRHAELGLTDLDLKDEVFGRGVLDLSDAQVTDVRAQADARGLSVYCLSTVLLRDEIERGEEHFRGDLTRVNRAIEIAGVLRPGLVRLIVASTSTRDPDTDLLDHLAKTAPWLLGFYREAISALNRAGFTVTIENEVDGCLFTSAKDATRFFGELPGREAVNFTWDIQNLWEAGESPSVGTYRELRDIIGYVHVKGGIADESGHLKWKSSLRDCSWPVAEILRDVIADGVSPVICVNPCHGQAPDGYDSRAVAAADIQYVQQLTGELVRLYRTATSFRSAGFHRHNHSSRRLLPAHFIHEREARGQRESGCVAGG
jgi:sugar phosphate isomerase/epimerase